MALILNVFFILGILASLGGVLTLPGIAGIVLTMGMAVDANVLIYERIQEEIFAGKGVKLAVNEGFKEAMSAIIDGNVTTLFAGIILYFFGSGPIKGFATTLIIGIMTSLFTSIFITRLIFEWQMKHNISLTFTSKLTRNWLRYTNIKFIEIRKYAYMISGFFIVVSCFQLPSADSIWVWISPVDVLTPSDSIRKSRFPMFRNLWLLFWNQPLK